MRKIDLEQASEIAGLRSKVDVNALRVFSMGKQLEAKKAAFRAAKGELDEAQRLWEEASEEKKEGEGELIQKILDQGKIKDERLNKMLVTIEEGEGGEEKTTNVDDVATA